MGITQYIYIYTYVWQSDLSNTPDAYLVHRCNLQVPQAVTINPQSPWTALPHTVMHLLAKYYKRNANNITYI